MTLETSSSGWTWPRQSWFLRGPLLSTIAMVAAVAALATELTVMLIAAEESWGYLGIGLSAIGLLVIFRARWVGLSLTTAGGIASALFADEYIGVWTVTVFATFIFARQGRHVLPAVTVSASSLYLALVLREGGDFDAAGALIAATFCVAAGAAGSAVRLQTESWDAARQRAEDLAMAQAAQLQQAVTDERLRIARDLHDVVGHELAVVNVNVGVAEISLPENSDASRAALRSAREGLQRTLQETQQILDLLRRTNDENEHRVELPLAEHIPSMVERLRIAGSVVETEIVSPLPSLDAEVSAAAYRIVQEALTNAGKYGTGPARLTVVATDGWLDIDVVNAIRRDDPSVNSERDGYGLVGVRERTQAAGGELTVFQTDDTFRLHVELPTKGRPQ
ncbi:histidine kinase [Microbacterium terrae]|nr:two-component sensor histidine kinase [Microbacterium terrae]